MSTDRRSLLAGGVALATLAAGRVGAQTAPPVTGDPLPPGLPEPTEVIDLWPGAAPGIPATPPIEEVIERSTNRLVANRSVEGVAVPRMAVFRPDRPNGAAVLVIPGGGYRLIAFDHEGYDIARRLNASGFTAFVLFYRLPGEGWADRANAPVSDAQRAMRLIRQRAAQFGIVPERVAAMGFSAGGHLCADLSTRYGQQVYQPVDAADTLSARPFCAAPIYPVISMSTGPAHAGSRENLLGPDPAPSLEAAHSPHRNVPADAPPFFLVHAEDDATVPVENALLMRAALKERGIPVETHLFQHGGHGFSLRGAIGRPAEVWLDLWRAWVRETGLA